MHIYAFGSVSRGEIDLGSDIDLLAIVDGIDLRLNPADYSIYSYSRIKELWSLGNPFAWHLSLEAKLIYSSDDRNFMSNLGEPSDYKDWVSDCNKFYNIFIAACKSLSKSRLCETFDLSSIFLATRNFATCYSLAFCNKPNFSRYSAQRLGQHSIQIGDQEYRIFERARILCTRGTGNELTKNELLLACNSIGEIEKWMSKLLEAIKRREYE